MISALKKQFISKVAAGGLHNLAITRNGHLYSWGRAEGGQLGIEQEELENNESTNDGYHTPVLVADDLDLVDIAAGTAHSVACSRKGQAYSWGWGAYGQLGQGFTGENFQTGTGNMNSTRFVPEEVKMRSDNKVM